MRISLMVEGQENVTWDQWCALADACESAGLEGLFRSDHYLSVSGYTERGSLDAWTTLAGLAARTSRIRLGTLVSPATFRHPSVLAKSVATVDHISSGRAELGIGAGWNVAEHTAYGFPFPENPVRMEMLAEQIEIVHRQWSDLPFDFKGKHYTMNDLNALPKPVQAPHPNLIVGGGANPRSAALAARWADEYNVVYASPRRCADRRERVAAAWEAEGRDPATLVFSVMTGCIVGRNRREVEERARRVMELNGDGGSVTPWIEGLREEWPIGTVNEVVEHLGRLEDAGVERAMLQHLAHDDTDMVHVIGAEVAPQLAAD
jgi:F420-dependent oxidoreductase-like protein